MKFIKCFLFLILASVQTSISSGQNAIISIESIKLDLSNYYSADLRLYSNQHNLLLYSAEESKLFQIKKVENVPEFTEINYTPTGVFPDFLSLISLNEGLIAYSSLGKFQFLRNGRKHDLKLKLPGYFPGSRLHFYFEIKQLDSLLIFPLDVRYDFSLDKIEAIKKKLDGSMAIAVVELDKSGTKVKEIGKFIEWDPVYKNNGILPFLRGIEIAVDEDQKRIFSNFHASPDITVLELSNFDESHSGLKGKYIPENKKFPVIQEDHEVATKKVEYYKKSPKYLYMWYDHERKLLFRNYSAGVNQSFDDISDWKKRELMYSQIEEQNYLQIYDAHESNLKLLIDMPIDVEFKVLYQDEDVFYLDGGYDVEGDEYIIYKAQVQLPD